MMKKFYVDALEVCLSAFQFLRGMIGAAGTAVPLLAPGLRIFTSSA